MPGSVCGYVVRADNESPLMGATVMISGRGGAPDIAPLTDSAGWFALDGLPPGKWVLRARGPANETGETTVPIFNNASTNVTIRVGGSLHHPISPSRTGGLEGHVLRARTNLPVENATVTVARGPGPAPGIAPLTDSAGWFAMDGLAPGDWVLQAFGPNEESGEATVRVSSGALASVTIAVEDSMQNEPSSAANHPPNDVVSPQSSGTIEGHVVQAKTGLPVENATVTIVQGAGASPDIAPVTDSAGWFALDALPPGDWVLRANAPNGETGEVAAHLRAGGLAQVTIEVSSGKRRSTSLALRAKGRAKSSRPDKSKKARLKGRGSRSRG